MNIMGLHLGHDASCAIIKDNRLVALVEKERLTRIKYDRGYSQLMVDTAIALAGLELRDIDHITVSIPAGNQHEASVNEADLWGITITKDGRPYRKGPRQMDPWEYEDGLNVQIMGMNFPGSQVQHHVAHCASSYYLSNMDDAECFSYDGSGRPDDQNSILMRGDAEKLIYGSCPNVNSALYFGQAAHRALGNWRDSGKLMGLSAYGQDADWGNSLPLLGSLDDGWDAFTRLNLTNKEQVAASAQQFLMNEIIMLEDEYLTSGSNLCISGGGALNIYANSYLSKHHNVFCAPYCKDDGLSVGASLYVLHHIMGEPRETYTTQEITFLGTGDDYRIPESSIELVAERLYKHNDVVFWHQGRSEGGPRALSHRSILALPTVVGNKVRVSERIKGRESYRPLAPMVTKEFANQYFQLDYLPDAMSELMLINAQVADVRLSEVTHVDGTARVQTISKEFNPVMHKLLTMVGEMTGIPVLINTSLNILGTAINETHADTLWAYAMSPEVNCAMLDGTVLLKCK